MRRAIVLYAVLGTVAAVGQGQEPVSPARDTGPDPTGSLPDAAYPRLAALVERLEDDPSGQELHSYCAMHGAEAALNALYLGRRFGNAVRVEGLLGGLLPAEAKLIRRFDAAGQPDPRDLEFVVVRGRFGYDSFSGWLARSGPEGAEVLAEDLSVRSCTADDITRLEPDAFPEHCRAFFSIKLVDPKAEDASLAQHDALSAWHDAPNTSAFESCVLADWSFRRGDVGNALKLWAHARAIVAHPFSNSLPDGETFEHFITEELATALEQQAVFAAGKGESRAELRERWRTIAGVRAEAPTPADDPKFRRFRLENARAMVPLYDRLLAEDEAWHEPTPEELATREPAALAVYWMHKVRDSRAGREAGGTYDMPWLLWGPEDDPARRLFALGWAAIPVLIEHCDDLAPTRGHGSWNLRGTGGRRYTQWRYADVCVELLTLITGERLLDRAAAAEWWKTNRKTDLAAFYLEQLRSADRDARQRAALWLVTLDDMAHVDVVIARVLEGDEARTTMLGFLRGHLREPALPKLVPLLEHADLATAIATAKALEHTPVAHDARDALLRRVVKDPSDERAGSALSYLAAAQDDQLRATFVRLLRTLKGTPRDLLLDWAHLFPCQDVLDTLVGLLGKDGGAVIAVHRMLVSEDGVGDAEHEAWREAEVREWLARNGANQDWPALQRDVRTRMCGWLFYPDSWALFRDR